MSDPLRHDDSAGDEAPSRQSRIEEMLLAGLDHYFRGEYELAINVWTRVLFLDRSHPRARAYIERARGALAERQRETEELLQTGAAAFARGDSASARRLLTSAIERGAPAEEALALLERVDRLAPATEHVAVLPPVPVRHPVRSAVPGVRSPRWAALSTLVFVLGVGLAAGAVGVLVLGAAGVFGADAVPRATPPPVLEPLPVPGPSEVWLARARALHAKGRPHDALAALGSVRPGDPMQAEADELRATIQRELLTAAHAAAEARVPHP